MASREVKKEEIPVELYNIWEDETEREDLSKKKPEIVSQLLKSFNFYWRNRPPQYNWRFFCKAPSRFIYNSSLCLNRTSHLFSNISQKSISNGIPCRFELPFISDDDPRVCGDFFLVNVRAVFIARIRSLLAPYFFSFIFLFFLFLASFCFLCKRKSNKPLTTTKPNNSHLKIVK